MDIANFFLLFLGAFTSVFALIIAALSIYEKEFYAAKRCIVFFLVGLFFVSLSYWYSEWIYFLSVVTGVALASTIIYLFWPYKRNVQMDDWSSKIDERDIMFSRARMQPETDRFISYYKRKPENWEVDQKWRMLPGLMSPKSKLNHSLLFASADASFRTVEALHALAETGRKEEKKGKYSQTEITNYVKQWAKHLGALDCGVTQLKDNHFYSHIGRGDEYGNEVVQNHKFAIAFTVEMSKQMMDSAPKAPCVMESALQYLNAGSIATQLAEFIRNLGYDARAHIDGNYRVVCPTIAVDAGLGEISRMGLLMTPKHGPRVRIAVVTTDMPLDLSEVKRNRGVIDFCRICKRCADVCPARAIEWNDRTKINGALRWQINSEKCFTYWCSSGTDCGRCMSVCPFSHPNNWLHNMVRFMINRFPNFRPLVLWFDDFLYGRKPKTKPFPWWIPSK